ncbi:hypothetical protein llap_19325 [Limosa lapponica baueri]|uniref:Uncharacterized protein n=1 Tax=Limosa lapponica baueri TaxID=1758121 RepID=A0A2I0T981_LIMLA|nr:hypothetical protein llap_19325 [Limosa lapponica baueri]
MRELALLNFFHPEEKLHVGEEGRRVRRNKRSKGSEGPDAMLRHEGCLPCRAPGRAPTLSYCEKHRSVFIRRGEGDWMPGKIGKEMMKKWFVHGMVPAEPKS